MFQRQNFLQFLPRLPTRKTCWDALTPSVIERAKLINLPVCQYKDKPECFTKKEK
jgi:hypothetical protein